MRLTFFILSILLSVNCLADQSSNYWNKQSTKLPSNFIFCYGIAVNSEMRVPKEQTEKQIYQAIAARISPSFGYARSWNYRSSYGKTVIGLRKATNGSANSVNGVIYPVKDEANFPQNVKSEYGYNLIEVPSEYIEAASWQQLPTNAKFWTYVVSDEYFQYSDKAHPITQAYLDMTMQGFLEYGIDYAKEFLLTTDGWSKYWLNDRVMARNPWHFKGEYKDYDMIDTILEEYFVKQSKENYFKNRKFSEEY